MGRIAGVDAGGTFTDAVDETGSFLKVASTPGSPSEAVSASLGRLVPARDAMLAALAHGTTVATNALLERSGARVALVVNEGFGDMIEIGRQDRPSLYDQWADRPEPLVARSLRYEIAGRLGADGKQVVPLGDVPEIAGADSVAICLLHSDLDDAHERRVEAELSSRGMDVCRSSAVSPEFREYERASTTTLNAYLRPVCRAYLRDLEPLAEQVVVMTSAGGLVPLAEAAERPVTLLLSGPAAGARAGAAAAVAAGFPDAVTFDMGGTSTDLCLIRGGRPEPAAQRAVAGLPVRLPALDIHTIGAGGGSIARVDPGGALVVGPQSAGARPGPACYRLGGRHATVTDADLVAGRIPAGRAFGSMGSAAGRMPALDPDAAAAALGRAGVSAAAVISVADAAMTQALRVVTVERGVDPRGLALVAFGGAGPLHACALAEALGMEVVVVPPRAGVLSAVGLLCSPRQVDLVRSWHRCETPNQGPSLEETLAELGGQARESIAGGSPGDGRATEPIVETSVDCRYEGQSHELTVASVEDFEEEHKRRNGYARSGNVIEVVALRARATVPGPLTLEDLPEVKGRSDAIGPCALAEPDCTVWLAEGWRAETDPAGSWVLRRR